MAPIARPPAARARARGRLAVEVARASRARAAMVRMVWCGRGMGLDQNSDLRSACQRHREPAQLPPVLVLRMIRAVMKSGAMVWLGLVYPHTIAKPGAAARSQRPRLNTL